MKMILSSFNFLFKSFVYALVFFLKYIITIRLQFSYLLTKLYSILSTFIELLIGKEKLLNYKLKNSNIPNHIGLIITEYNMLKLLSLIDLIKYSKIAKLTLYDPFNYYSHLELNKNEKNLKIKYYNFQNANNDLITSFVKSKNNNKINKFNKNHKEITAEINRLLTKKKSQNLPELILLLKNKQYVSLFGFPFTLLENTEIL